GTHKNAPSQTVLAHLYYPHIRSVYPLSCQISSKHNTETDMALIFSVSRNLPSVVLHNCLCNRQADPESSGISTRFIRPVKPVKQPAQLDFAHVLICIFHSKMRPSSSIQTHKDLSVRVTVFHRIFKQD